VMALRGNPLSALLLAAWVGLLAVDPPAAAAAGFHVVGGKLLDVNGKAFVMRGINHPHTWFPNRTAAFADIKTVGKANAVRVVLSGGRWQANTTADVTNVIRLCKASRLVCVLENHDPTGYGEQSGATTLAQAVTYWKSVQSALAGQEAYTILNIGNEPFANNNAAAWTQATKEAIAALRVAGFTHTLMVDAPNWGQDWQSVMRTNAAAVFAADSLRNTVFSVHMYGWFNTAARVQSYIEAFATAGLPLAIGEFGPMHSDGDPDEDAIMSTAQARGIGYLGWSWGGNAGGEVAYLDMLKDFNPAQFSPWGERIIKGANGLAATSVECSCFGGTAVWGEGKGRGKGYREGFLIPREGRFLVASESGEGFLGTVLDVRGRAVRVLDGSGGRAVWEAGTDGRVVNK
jgi:mannan endo-1,4-beta-mannosidase